MPASKTGKKVLINSLLYQPVLRERERERERDVVIYHFLVRNVIFFIL